MANETAANVADLVDDELNMAVQIVVKTTADGAKGAALAYFVGNLTGKIDGHPTVVHEAVAAGDGASERVRTELRTAVAEHPFYGALPVFETPQGKAAHFAEARANRLASLNGK